MSDDGPEWFAPKRYGYGSGFPISWQGWAVSLAYLAAVGAIALLVRHQAVAFIAAIIPPTLIFILVAARTTRGGWRWHWGGDE